MHASAHSHWLQPVSLPQLNARSESVAEKPAFRRLVPSRRCLVRVGAATTIATALPAQMPVCIPVHVFGCLCLAR